ncbi:MAG: hypothetical protein AAFW89_10495 [Bacteroidota bacterium]
MGQQQLLLVILVTIIVGVATVIAITTFGNSSDAANMDAVRNEMISIGASAQGYFAKPEMIGGGSKNFAQMEFSDLIFGADSISADGLTAYNANATYSFQSRTNEYVCLVATPASDSTKELHVDITDSDMIWYSVHGEAF